MQMSDREGLNDPQPSVFSRRMRTTIPDGLPNCDKYKIFLVLADIFAKQIYFFTDTSYKILSLTAQSLFIDKSTG